MSQPEGRLNALNRIAGLVATLVLVAVAVLWTRERFRDRATAVFDPARFAVLTPPATSPDERWLVAVNPGCSHCREHLVALEARLVGSPEHARLGALIVDTPQRPDTLTLAPLAPAGVWWDSAGIWRQTWEHRVYGEVLQFAADGSLRATRPPGWSP